MPRERVRPHKLPGTIVDPGGPDDGKPFVPESVMVVDVGWTRGMPGVGVHTQPEAGAGRLLLEMVNGWLETAKMPPIDIDELLAADPGFGWADSGGFNAGFDFREDVNHLIRILRRARDGAFGKDE